MKNFTDKLKIKVMKEDESYHEYINKMRERPEVDCDKLIVEYGSKIAEEMEIIFGMKVVMVHLASHCPVYHFKGNKDFEFFLNIREFGSSGKRVVFFIRDKRPIRGGVAEDKFNSRATFLSGLEKKLEKSVS